MADDNRNKRFPEFDPIPNNLLASGQLVGVDWISLVYHYGTDKVYRATQAQLGGAPHTNKVRGGPKITRDLSRRDALPGASLTVGCSCVVLNAVTADQDDAGEVVGMKSYTLVYADTSEAGNFQLPADEIVGLSAVRVKWVETESDEAQRPLALPFDPNRLRYDIGETIKYKSNADSDTVEFYEPKRILLKPANAPMVAPAGGLDNDQNWRLISATSPAGLSTFISYEGTVTLDNNEGIITGKTYRVQREGKPEVQLRGLDGGNFALSDAWQFNALSGLWEKGSYNLEEDEFFVGTSAGGSEFWGEMPFSAGYPVLITDYISGQLEGYYTKEQADARVVLWPGTGARQIFPSLYEAVFNRTGDLLLETHGRTSTAAVIIGANTLVSVSALSGYVTNEYGHIFQVENAGRLEFTGAFGMEHPSAFTAIVYAISNGSALSIGCDLRGADGRCIVNEGGKIDLTGRFSAGRCVVQHTSGTTRIRGVIAGQGTYVTSTAVIYSGQGDLWLEGKTYYSQATGPSLPALDIGEAQNGTIRLHNWHGAGRGTVAIAGTGTVYVSGSFQAEGGVALGIVLMRVDDNGTVIGGGGYSGQAFEDVSQDGEIVTFHRGNGQTMAITVGGGPVDIAELESGFKVGYPNQIDWVVTATMSGTLTEVSKSNVAGDVVYRKNNAVVPLGTAFEAGASFSVSVTKADPALAALVINRLV
jgi:hypothetical protein